MCVTTAWLEEILLHKVSMMWSTDGHFPVFWGGVDGDALGFTDHTASATVTQTKVEKKPQSNA